MSAVEERVVEMRFDNKQFEKNIKDSIKSLDDLDRQLGLLDDNDSLENVERSARKLDFSRLTEGVGELGEKFNWLEKIATGVLYNIGSKISNMVTQYAGQLSFQQIRAGWGKYGDYSTATQTTLAATYNTWEDEANEGERLKVLLDELGDPDIANKINDTFKAFEKGEINMRSAAIALNKTRAETEEMFNTLRDVETDLTQEDYVEKYIEKLNWYSDETSYNFNDMVSTLSKFTAAGQTLKDGTRAIQGMMNMVAVAGGNAATGQRVSYNLSQAMGVGALTTIDFKSLENANVATVEFKQKLLETAAAMGVIKKVSGEGAEAVYRYQNTTMSATEGFRDSLSKKWVTSDVLQKTLEEYGKFSEKIYEFTDAYGMTAREALSEVDAYAAAMSENADPEAVDEWHKHIQEMFGNDTERAADYEKMLEELSSEDMDFSRRAFEEAQAAKTFRDAIDATADAVSTKWMNIFKYVFGSSERAKEFWSNFTETLYEIFAGPLDMVLDLFEKVDKFPARWDAESKSWISPFEVFRQSLDHVQAAILSIITPIREAFGDVFLRSAAANIASLSNRFFNFTKGLILGEEGSKRLKSSATVLFSILRGINKVIGSVFKIVKPLFGLLGPVARLVGTIASSLFRVVGALLGVDESASNSGIFKFCEDAADAVGTAVDFISGAIDALIDWINKNVNLEQIKNQVENLKKAMVPLWNNIKKSASDAWKAVKDFLGIEDIKTAFDEFWRSVQGFLPSWEDVTAGLLAGWELLKQVGTAIWTFVNPYLKKLGQSLSKLWKSISDFITGFIGSENKLAYIKDHFRDIFESFIEWKRNSNFISFLIKSFDTLKDTILKVKDALFKKNEEGSSAGQFFGILYLVSSLAALFLVLRNVDKIITGLKNISKAVKNFAGFLNKLALFGGIFLAVTAITKLVQALTVFSQLKPGEIVAGVLSAVGLMAALVFFTVWMKKVIKDMSEADIKNLRKLVVSLSIVLLAIAGSMWILSKAKGLTWEPLMLIGIMTAVVLAAYALTKYVDDIKVSTIAALLAIAAVILVAAIAIEKIGHLDASQFERAKTIILILAGVAVASMVIGAILQKGSETMKNIAVAVGVMAGSLLLIVLSLHMLQNIQLNAGMVAILISIIAVLGILAAIPIYMSKFARNNMVSEKDMTKMARTVGLMTISILAITVALGLLAKSMAKAGMNSGDMLKLSVVILIIAASLGVMAFLLAYATSALAGSDSEFNNMKKTAKSVRSMVVSILLIVAAIAVMNKMGLTFRSALEPIGIILAIAAILTAMVHFMAKASVVAGENGIQSKPIIAMVLGIVAIAGVIMILSKLLQNEDNKLWQAVLIIAAIAAIITISMRIIGGATKVAGGNIQWAPIAVLVLGIIGIMHMLIVMSAVDQGALRKAAVSLAIVIGVMTALMASMALLQKSSSKTGNTIRAIVMLGAIVLAVVGMAYTLKQLQGVEVPWDSIWQIVAVLGILGAIFGGLGVLAGATHAGGGLVAISLTVIAIAAAILILAAAASIAAEALPALAAGMQKVFEVIDGITADWGDIVKFAAVLLTLATFGTAAMIGMGAGALIMAAGFFIGALALSIVSGILPELSSGLTILITTLAMMEPAIKPAISSAWGLVKVFALLMLGGIALGIGLAVAGIGLGVVGGAAMILATAIGIASLAVSALVLSFALLAEGIARVIDLFKGGNLSAEVSSFSDSVKSSTGEITSSVGEMKATLADEGGFNLTDMFSIGGANGDSLLNKDSLMSGLGDLFGGDGMQSMLSGGFTDSLSGAMGDLDLTQIMGPLGDQMGGFDFASMMEDSGAGDNLVNGLFSSVSEEGMEESANDLATEFSDTISSSSNKGKATSSGGTLGQAGSSGASSTHRSWSRSGTYVAQGFIDGVASKIEAADLIGSKLALTLIEACKEQLGVQSPSRVFYEIGEYAVMGFANGITGTADLAITSIEDMAKDTIASAAEALAAAIENDYSSPVITPVLDLTNVAEGASRISSMFGNSRVGVEEENQNGENQASGVTYNYTQNNYSPKALSRIEIYRQTRNQLSTLSV